VRVHSLTLSYTPESMKCDSRASFLARTFASPCLGRKPKARVVTIVVICEKNEFVNLNYNAILTTLKANIVVKNVVTIVIAKSSLICTNCGKIGHKLETCHNMKREVLVVLTTIVKFTQHVAKIKTQLAKPIRIPICYPYITYYSVEHRSRECPRKIKVQNMFKIKLASLNTTTTPKSPKLDNVPINVVAVVINCSQQL
jgi:hypothetical protein